MRKLFLIIMMSLLLFGLLSPVVFASPDTSSKKPLLAVLPVINSSGLRGGSYVKDVVNESLAEKFSSNERYIVVSGSYLLDGLHQEGIEDFRKVDAATLQAALRNMRIDYCLRTEVLFVVTDQWVKLPSALFLMKSWGATVPLKVTVTDVNQGVVYSDTLITDYGQHDAMVGFAKQRTAVREALYKVLDRFDREVVLP